VDRISLHVPPGVIFGFLGPNGAGKTTTIKMMAGVLRPTHGQIMLNGFDMAATPSQAKAAVGFIPDRPFLYEKLTGLELLHFVARLYRMGTTPELEERIAELLALFELTDWSDELIESYSHGMKQRLVMCAALLHRPRILIVDEPMVGLDPKGARLVKDIFREEAARGTAVFMSTHSLEVAEEVCEHIAIIQGGRIVAEGTAQTLQDQAGSDGNLEQVFLKLTAGRSPFHE
jgi:ABC-2 type transport system ATP-binding protein